MTNIHLDKSPNESFADYKWRILLDKAKGELDIGWKEVDSLLNLGLANDTIRKGSIFLPEFHDYMVSKTTSPTENTYKYKETTEILGDGSHRSDKVVEMSPEQSKDSTFLLKSHGFDVDEWEITSAKNSIWNANSKADGIRTLYSSKITVKPKVNGFNIDKIVESIQKNIKPYKRKVRVENGKNLLEIFLTDMHFGVNDFDYYKDTLDEILELVASKEWDTIYIPIGSDALHNDDFKGRTTNDTVIEKVDMEQAWEDAYQFYSILYEHALENSNKVVSHYICGNHDKTTSYGLVKALSKVYTEVEWDTSTVNKKLFTWKDVAILAMHGDKGTQRISKTIYKEYGKLIADKKVVEIHTGDKHHTKTDDSHGVLFRILPTKAKTDEWHNENSFTGSMKCFHIFEYKEDMLKTIHHV